LTTRDSFDINVGRVVGSTYDTLQDGRITNRLRFRVRNQTGAPTSYTVSIADPENAMLQIAGATPVQLESGEMKRIEAFVFLPESEIVNGVRSTTLLFEFADGTQREVDFTLIGPSN
ncbi:MAG: hypothetical protein HKN13_02835, partial [Rhodothermales bacterium]|nr:hypothetical protein [Rhodothermales bacterium]